ncbi:radical SAM protein [Methylomicrobium lacus]|uniref:radical SAM protein n=1 Tax=Methylomicrobium lacus TaxID=136992 RepID=UPI00045E5A44|nr:radical SAM protein [Methylomicrobium lacus]
MLSNPATKPAQKAHAGFQAAYLALLESGELEQRVRIARRHLQDCDLCARYCRVDRIRTVQGAVCRIGERAVVYSYGPHHGEEDVLEATLIAAHQGLRLPLVYNTGGFDSPEALALLDGVIDIYMPDMKYGDSAIAHRYSHVRNYWEVNQAAVREMHRQVGDLQLDKNGLAYRGLWVRHLVLPNGLAGTGKVLEFIAREISTGTYLNLMDQYYPCYRAGGIPELSRPVSAAEYQEALAVALRLGLTRQSGA